MAKSPNQTTKKQEIRTLERVIAHLDTLYELGEPCIHPDTQVEITDGQYDAFRRRLKQLQPQSKLFETATASEVSSTIAKVVHDPPLTSIEKASHEDINVQEQQLFKWLVSRWEDAPKNRGKEKQVIAGKLYRGQPVEIRDQDFYLAYKLDGVAIGLYYVDGKLTKAGLRPRDGINGEDVTQQCQYVEGIPQTLKRPVTCSIRGELICRLSDFKDVQKDLESAGEKLRANPRNHTAGGIRQFKNPEKTKIMRLSFVAYTIEGMADPPYKTELERAAFCRDKLGVPYVETEAFRFERLAQLEAAIDKLDFEVDGVVIGVNNLEDQEQLGRHGDPRTGNPKGKIAWKFREEEAHPVINEIQWQTGRTGKIVGVAIFDPVRLAGTNVSRATLHNAGFIQRNQITVGSTISVRKAGKIIPKVTGVIAGQGELEFPKTCEACGTQTELREGATEDMLQLVCPSPTCSAQNISGLCHYLSTFGVLGLGESRVTQLVEGGKVGKPADFYRLTVEDAMETGLTVRQSSLAVAAVRMLAAPDKVSTEDLQAAIEASRERKIEIPLWQLFASFGIGSAGKAAGKALSEHFGSFKKIRSASIEELEAVDDVGEITAVAIREYLDANEDDIDDLLQFVQPTVPESGGKLDGLTFCFSGGFPEGKKHWEAEVESRGGQCTGSVSKKTNYLVAGPGSGSKTAKAEKLEIPIITTDDLVKMF
jgi:DNA ligase (NAD+)